MEFYNSNFQASIDLEKEINPESLGKVMEIYFTILCIIELCPEFQCGIAHISHYSFPQLSTLK